MTRTLTDQRITRFTEVAGRRQLDVSVVCENLHDPHNISAVMRSADAFGVGSIEVVGASEEFRGHPKTSASARRWVEVNIHDNIVDCIRTMKEQGKRVFATRLDPNARSIYEVDWTQPCAIILGNEHAGVSEEAAQLADESVFIPMSGMVQSLNVSVANGVILGELFRQRQLSGRYDGALTHEREALLSQWFEREQNEK